MALTGTELHVASPALPRSAVGSGGHVFVNGDAGEFGITDLTAGVGRIYTAPLQYTARSGMVVESGTVYSLHGDSGGSFNGYIYSITSGAVATLVSATSTGYWAPLVADSGYLISNNKIIKISDGSSRTAVAGAVAVAAGAGKVWLTNSMGGTTIYRVDLAANTLDATHTLAAATQGYIAAAYKPGTLYFRTTSTSFPILVYNTTTGTSYLLPLTPAGTLSYSTYGNLALHSDGNLYGVAVTTGDVNVINPTTGEWYTGLAVAARANREPIASYSGKLYIPSQHPSPWPGGWP